jgi:hypothetical protein
MEYYLNKSLVVRSSSIHGKGIFAEKNFQKEVLLEISPIIELGLPLDLITDQVLKDYIFLNGKTSVLNFGPKTYLGLGYISLYNHQDDPNANIIFDFKNLKATVIAKRDINIGDEIFISYGSNYFKFRKLFNNLNDEVRKKLFELDQKLFNLEK